MTDTVAKRSFREYVKNNPITTKVRHWKSRRKSRCCGAGISVKRRKRKDDPIVTCAKCGRPVMGWKRALRPYQPRPWRMDVGDVVVRRKVCARYEASLLSEVGDMRRLGCMYEVVELGDELHIRRLS
jgi:hypothetical protein